MEKEKYYTPEIEAFFIGFEVEWQCKIRNETWNKQICDVDLVNIAYDAIEHSDDDEPFSEQFRVKFLDRQDIEACGWRFIKKGDPFSKETLIFALKKEGGFNTGVDYELTQHPHQPSVVYLAWQSYLSYGSDKGQIRLTIKNKNELQTVMKMLGI